MQFYFNALDSSIYFVMIVVSIGVWCILQNRFDSNTANLEKTIAISNKTDNSDQFYSRRDMSEETEEAYYVQRIEYLNSSFQKITYVKKIIELLAIISTMLLIICNFSYSPTTRSKIYQAKVTNLSLDSDNPHGIPFDIFTKKNSIWIKSEAAIFPGSRAIRYSDKVQAPQLQVKTQTTKRLLWSIFEPNRVVTSKDYYLILPVSDLK